MFNVASAALILWPLVAVGLFLSMPSRRALLVTVIAGFLFLPVSTIALPGLPAYSKTTAIAAAGLAGALLFDAGTLLRYRWSWFDAFPLAGLFGTAASSLTNGLGINDAGLEFISHLTDYTILYFLGRAYFSTPAEMRELAIAISIGMAVYVPLMLWEVRMSPQLHRQVYGFATWGWYDVNRDGWRPRVFQPTALGLGIWAACSTLVIWWLWLGRSTRSICGVPIAAVAVVALGVTYLTKCLGAFLLLLFGIGCLVAHCYLGWRRIVLTTAAVVAIYLGSGLLGDAVPLRTSLMSFVGMIGREDKEGSLKFRFVHEGLLVDHAMRAPVFGWGGHGRNRPTDAAAIRAATAAAGIPVRSATVTDGLWTIIIGQNGLVGLVAMWGWMVVPGVCAVLWVRRLQLPLAAAAPTLGLAAFSFTYAIDMLLNAFRSPVQPLAAGALASFAIAAARFARQRPRVRNSSTQSAIARRPPRPTPAFAEAG